MRDVLCHTAVKSKGFVIFTPDWSTNERTTIFIAC